MSNFVQLDPLFKTSSAVHFGKLPRDALCGIPGLSDWSVAMVCDVCTTRIIHKGWGQSDGETRFSNNGLLQAPWPSQSHCGRRGNGGLLQSRTAGGNGSNRGTGTKGGIATSSSPRASECSDVDLLRGTINSNPTQYMSPYLSRRKCGCDDTGRTQGLHKYLPGSVLEGLKEPRAAIWRNCNFCVFTPLGGVENRMKGARTCSISFARTRRTNV